MEVLIGVSAPGGSARQGVQLGSAIAEDVVAVAPRLVARACEVQIGDEERLAVRRAGDDAAVGIDDHARLRPAHTALLAGAVGLDDVDPARVGRRHRDRDLDRDRLRRARRRRRVHGHRDDLGAREGGAADVLGERGVEADGEPDAAGGGVDDGRREVPGHEDLRLAVPQVRLAVDGADAGRVHDDGGVAQRAVGVELAEAGDDHEAVRPRARRATRARTGRPRARRRRAPRRRRRTRSRSCRARAGPPGRPRARPRQRARRGSARGFLRCRPGPARAGPRGREPPRRLALEKERPTSDGYTPTAVARSSVGRGLVYLRAQQALGMWPLRSGEPGFRGDRS